MHDKLKYLEHLLLSCLERIDLQSRRQEHLMEKLLMNVQELQARLDAAAVREEKIGAEVVALRADFDSLVSNGVPIPQAIEDAIVRLETAQAGTDAVNPDAVVVTPALEPTPAPVDSAPVVDSGAVPTDVNPAPVQE